MVATNVNVAETDLVKLILEFLESRGLHITQVSLERETGLINGMFSEDALFLRQLIIDGQWDSALDFADPLNNIPDFPTRHFRYLITKYKYFELLCIKQEPGPMQNNDFTVEEVVECLKELEQLCPTQEDHRQLCALLTLPKLSDHADFKNWNPSSARVECFLKVYPLIQKFLPAEKPNNIPASGSLQASQVGIPIGAAINDRFIQLVTKGLFYESCVDYCQSKAVREGGGGGGVKIPTILETRNRLGTADVSLVSWLEALSLDQFSLPFEQKGLDLKVESLRRPTLDAQWTEQILATPIKPHGFPHSAVPTGRLKSAEKMSRSMLPNLEGNGLMTSSGTMMSDAARPRTSALSMSMAPGFQIRPSPPSHAQASQAAMQQSQIDMLFETSDLIRSTMGQLQPEVSGPPTAPMAPTCHLPPPPHEMSPREQLEEIKRRSLTPNSVAQIPEHQQYSGTPPPSSAASGGGKLFHEFSSRHQQKMVNSQYRSSSEPPQSYGSMNGQMDGVTYQMMQMSMYQPSLTPVMGSPLGTPTHTPRPMSTPHRMASRVQEQMGEYARPITPGSGIHQQIVGGGGPQMSPAADYAPSRRVHYQVPHKNPQNSTAKRPPWNNYGKESSPMSPPGTSATKVEHEKQNGGLGGLGKNVQFVPVCRLEDSQAIRTAAFHPSGRYFVVGTNSKQMHICRYPDVKRIREDHIARGPEVLLTRPKQHRGSVYCSGFNPTGELLATGSNDKSLRLMSFNADSAKIGAEMELTMHDGTVRDLVFMEDTTNRTSLLISGGAGNCQIHLTDCATGHTFRSMTGHTAPILGLYTWSGCTFISCSQDKTIRFWDLRCPQAVNMIAPGNKTLSSPVTSACVDPGGRLLVSGHEDASIMLYDVTGSRVIQLFRPHGDEVRAVRFSPGTYYLLSGSYDKKICITDMRGDLLAPLLYLPVAEHHDKIIQCRWHPHDFTFLSTSADRSAVLWALPQPSVGM